MNNNLLIGIIVAAVVILGGIAMVVYGPSSDTSTSTATTTPSTSTGTVTTTTTTTTTSVASPVVTTGTLVVVSNSVAVVTGRVTPNGVQTSYWYEYGSTSALGSRTGTQAIGSGYISISAPAVVSGLTANATYYYRLVAENAYGAVTGQSYSFTTNSNPPIQSIGPTTRTDVASVITRTTANLNGHITPNGSDTSYWFEYGETSDLGNTTTLLSAGNGTVAQAVSASLNNLKPLTKYYFRVNAQNQFGTMTGGTMTFTTGGPIASGAPTVVTTGAGAIATSSATLRGHLNPNSYPTTYWFEYSTASSGGALTGNVTATPHVNLTGSATVTVTVSADIKNLNPNQKYFYVLRASNSYGSILGDITAFTTKR